MTEPTIPITPDPRGGPELDLIFSSRDGYVWVSWPQGQAVKLGRHELVAAMMRDFLAQDALGKRLSGLYPSGGWDS